MLEVVRTYTKYVFNLKAEIVIGKQKRVHKIEYSGSVKIKRKDNKNFLLLDAEQYFLKKNSMYLPAPSGRFYSLKNLINRAIYFELTVHKK